MDIEKFFDKVKAKWEAFKRYICSIPQNWVEGRRPRAIAKAAIPLTALLAIIAILLFLWKWRYVIGIILFIVAALYCLSVAEKGGKQKVSITDAVVMKHAREGLSVLLDHILLVAESLAEQTEIYSPRTKGELAYPDMKRCIHVEDGVAVNAVQLHYEGEIDTVKFLERFNNRMAQKLNSGELPGHPNPVFYDKDNETHTAIQAIRCTPVKGQKCIILEVIRVNQAAVALLDKLDRESAPEANGEDQLYDDEL